jgi:prepilin-type N-terminal cleavage/methylation domain-containing protein
MDGSSDAPTMKPHEPAAAATTRVASRAAPAAGFTLPPVARAAGFTLIEMLLVLSIMGVLMGISIGAFQHSVPARALARNAVIDSLRQARNFAMQENAPALVRLEKIGDDPPTVTAIGKKTVGTWHLEGTDLEGFPQAAHGEGVEEEESGALGRAARLSVEGSSWLDFGISPSFDTTYGCACELFLRADAPKNQPLLSKGKGFVLRSDSDGSLKLTVRVRDHDEKGDPRDTFRSVETGRTVLVPHRFVKIAASFDGMSLRLAVDDVVVGEVLLEKPVPFSFDRDAPLLFGSYEQPAGVAVDELKWAIYDGTTQELRDMDLKEPRSIVRFAPDGSLDPQFHQGPVDLVLRDVSVDPEKPGLELPIRIGVLGDLH